MSLRGGVFTNTDLNNSISERRKNPHSNFSEANIFGKNMWKNMCFSANKWSKPVFVLKYLDFPPEDICSIYGIIRDCLERVFLRALCGMCGMLSTTFPPLAIPFFYKTRGQRFCASAWGVESVPSVAGHNRLGKIQLVGYSAAFIQNHTPGSVKKNLP